MLQTHNPTSSLLSDAGTDNANCFFVFPAAFLLGYPVVSTRWNPPEKVKEALLPYSYSLLYLPLTLPLQQFLIKEMAIGSCLQFSFGSTRTSLFPASQQYEQQLSNAPSSEFLEG